MKFLKKLLDIDQSKDKLKEKNDIETNLIFSERYIQEIITKLNLYNQTSLTEELDNIKLSINLDNKGDSLFPILSNRCQFYEFKFSDNNTSELFTLRILYQSELRYQNDKSRVSLKVYIENNEVKIDNEQLGTLLDAANAEKLLSNALTNFINSKNPENNQDEKEMNNTLISTTINKINAYREKILHGTSSHPEERNSLSTNKKN